MLAWDALVLLAAVLDGMRLPRAPTLTAARTWSNAPSLDSQTEIELTIENRGSVIIECRFMTTCRLRSMMPSAATDPIRVTAFPRVPASIRYRVEPQERGDCTTGQLYVRYRSPLATRRAMGEGPAGTDGPHLSGFAHRRRAADIPGAQPPDRSAIAANAATWPRARLRKPARLSRRRRLRDICWTASARRGNLITRQYQTERSQPVWIVLDCGRLMRSRVSQLPDQRGIAACGGQPPRTLQTRSRLHRRRSAGATRVVFRRSRRPARLRSDDPATPAARPRRRTPAPDDRTARAASRGIKRSRPPARHHAARPPSAPPITDSLDYRSRRDRDAPRGDRRRGALAAASCAALRRHGAARGGFHRATTPRKMWNKCFAPPPHRKWPVAANCFWRAFTSKAPSPWTSTPKP